MTCTVTVGGSPQRGVGASGGAGHAGAAVPCTSHTATVRGPNAASTSAGVDGQPPVPGTHAPRPALHQATTRVPNSAGSSCARTPSTSCSEVGVVVLVGLPDAAAARRAACSAADTAAPDCTA